MKSFLPHPSKQGTVGGMGAGGLKKSNSAQGRLFQKQNQPSSLLFLFATHGIDSYALQASFDYGLATAKSR